MTSNVHALERVKLMDPTSDRLDRAQVEAAFRTLLFNGPATIQNVLSDRLPHAWRAFEEILSATARIPSRF